MSDEERVTLPIPTSGSVHKSANLPEGHVPVIDTKFNTLLFPVDLYGTRTRVELAQPPDSINEKE